MENQVASYGPKAGLNSKDTICLKLVLSKTIKGRMEERKRRDFVYHGWEVPILVCSPLVGNALGLPPSGEPTRMVTSLYNQMKTTLLRWRLQFCPKILDAGELCCFVRIWDLKWDLETWRSSLFCSFSPLHAEPTNKKKLLILLSPPSAPPPIQFLNQPFRVQNNIAMLCVP